jgi:cytidine deaminase
VNLYHFNGGPCGELVALANAISGGEKEFTVIVAVGDRNRGILAPCGRCRQVLFDYCPDIQVILLNEDEYIMKPIQDLLPDVYDWRKHQGDGVSE